jgi:hypothetical protein
MASTNTPHPDSPRLRRYRKAAQLLQKWLLEDGQYDERTWPAVEQELKEGGARCRDDDETGA